MAVALIRFLTALVFATFAVLGLPTHSLADRPSPKAVIELFTSQGCSSCPPADRLLEKYVARDDVIALTLHVDYWDYLGWKDTLASAQYSQRQRRYARARGDGAVYTPQAVINGRTHAVGSHADKIDAAIAASTAAAGGPLPVSIHLRRVGDHLEITLPDDDAVGVADRGREKATVWVASVQDKVDVAVKRGENGGRELTYHNVVRGLSAVGVWMGEMSTLKVPLQTISHPKAQRCAVLLQDGTGGPLIGAAWLGH